MDRGRETSVRYIAFIIIVYTVPQAISLPTYRLILGYEKYGMCNNKWRKIQMDAEYGPVVRTTILDCYCPVFHPHGVCLMYVFRPLQLSRRSNGDLKDKYRNIQLSLSRNSLEPRKRDKGGDLPWTEEEKQA